MRIKVKQTLEKVKAVWRSLRKNFLEISAGLTRKSRNVAFCALIRDPSHLLN